MERITIKLLDVYNCVQGNTQEKNCKFEYSSLSYRVNSNTVFAANGKKVKAKTGDITFIPAKTVYDKNSKGENSIVVCFEIIGSSYNELKVFTPPERDYKEYFERMLRVWRAKETGYYYKTMVLFYGVLGFLDTDDFTFGNEGIADKIKSYMDDSFTLSEFTINDIASHFNFSEVYIRRVFKEKFGVSPKEYLQEKRISYACFLLLNTSFSVMQIAEKSGWGDEKYFSSAFKKEKGMSPSVYKKNVNQINEINFEE